MKNIVYRIVVSKDNVEKDFYIRAFAEPGYSDDFYRAKVIVDNKEFETAGAYRDWQDAVYCMIKLVEEKGYEVVIGLEKWGDTPYFIDQVYPSDLAIKCRNKF